MADPVVTKSPPKSKSLTAERVREVLHYDPQTGHFRWRDTASRFNPYAERDRAGYHKAGEYSIVCVDYARVYAHRLAWLYVHGEWPPRFIDHINGDRGDNRLANLRLADTLQNTFNRPASRRNKSGFKGVAPMPSGRWRAQIMIHRKQTFLGVFDTPEEASAAYQAAAARLFGDFARKL